MTDRDDELIKRMQDLLKESKRLADDHTNAVDEFQRVSKEIEELRRQQHKKNSN